MGRKKIFEVDLEQPENEPLKTWLQEYQNPRTRRSYSCNFAKFLEWSKKNPKQLVEEFNQKQARSLILQYQNHILKNYSHNSARALVNAVRAFYTSRCAPIGGLKRRVVQARAATGEHVFSLKDLQQIREIGDFKTKAMISTAASLGWEASAFLDIERAFVEKLVNRAKSQQIDFIGFDWTRVKTNSTQYGILTPTALHDLEKYLEATKENPTTKLFDITSQGLNKWLKSQVDKANISTLGNIRFHLIRKWLMSSLSNANLNAFEIKLILGKAISTSDKTYLQTLKKSALDKVKNAYPKFLSLVAYHNGAIKSNVTVQLAIEYMKAQEQFREHLKSQGLLKMMPPQLENRFERIMNLIIDSENPEDKVKVENQLKEETEEKERLHE